MQYQAVEKNDDALRPAMIRLAKRYGRHGYRKLTELPRIEGWRADHKKIERLWDEEGLQLPRRHIEEGQEPVRGTNSPTKEAAAPPQGQLDHPAATDAAEPRLERRLRDKLSNGRSYKMPTVLEECTRQALAPEVGPDGLRGRA